MFNSRIALAAGFMAVGLFTGSMAQAQNVVEVVRAQPDLGTFARIIERSGLTERLSGPGPFAIFAPTDDAIRQHPFAHRETLERATQPALQRFVLSHVATHSTALNFEGVGQFSETMLSGISVRFVHDAPPQRGDSSNAAASPGTITANGNAVTSNLRATNGIVHRLANPLTLD